MIKKGFSAVEVMITLFVATMFISTGYGLHIYISHSMAIARNRSIAANIAESHLRQRALKADNDDCDVTNNLKQEAPFEGEKLQDLKIETDLHCEDILIKTIVEVTYTINDKTFKERQILYVEKK